MEKIIRNPRTTVSLHRDAKRYLDVMKGVFEANTIDETILELVARVPGLKDQIDKLIETAEK